MKYQKPDQDGSETKQNDLYLVDAMTYTEAEARINFLMAERISGVFLVDKITKTNYAEVYNYDESELWFRVKVSLVDYDDETGKEKTSSRFILIQAEDVRDAFDKTKEVMKGSITGYVIPSVTYTKILEVFPYDEDERNRRELMDQGYRPVE